jgi:hypothetical protein
MVKNCTTRCRETEISYDASNNQKRRQRIVTEYLKVLGDQQLITSFAIIIAGWASRCVTTLYEFNTVTSIAYFAALPSSFWLSPLSD